MATIEEQKSIVEKCFDSEILKPYKTGIFIDTSKLPNSLDSQNAVTEIRRLFFLELELEMGEYMRKNINMCSEMVKFVMNFYENRDRAFSIISVEDVKKTYISLYNDLVQQS
uniref:Uncharacterized protein n=1 Tax=Panagrolaimus davidi TaxID=227884 RepID=A0A914QNL3_9BILA